jgi:CheY-like chemotaxis protein
MCTVLIVDDEASFLHIVRLVLERAGYTVLAASNGAEALEMAGQQQPDLIILDDMMPGLSGGEVCLQLKQDQALRQIPVVMHSAGARVKDPTYIASIGADDVLLKPSMPNDIIGMTQKFLQAGV